MIGFFVRCNRSCVVIGDVLGVILWYWWCEFVKWSRDFDLVNFIVLEWLKMRRCDGSDYPVLFWISFSKVWFNFSSILLTYLRIFERWCEDLCKRVSKLQFLHPFEFFLNRFYNVNCNRRTIVRNMDCFAPSSSLINPKRSFLANIWN